MGYISEPQIDPSTNERIIYRIERDLGLHEKLVEWKEEKVRKERRFRGFMLCGIFMMLGVVFGLIGMAIVWVVDRTWYARLCRISTEKWKILCKSRSLHHHVEFLPFFTR